MSLDNIMNNNLLLSLLSGAGASLAGPDSVAAQAINPVVQGVIGAQSKVKEQNRQMKLLAKLLGAGVEFKSDINGKATVSGDLATLLGEEMAKESGLGTVSSQGTPGSTPTKTTPTAPVTQPKSTQNGLLSSMLNFNSSPSDVPAYSDLVGLTPKDISDSLAGAVNVESLKQNALIQSRRDIIERQKMNIVDPMDKPFVSDAPGYGNLSLRQYKELPTKDREYLSYVLATRQLGEAPMNSRAFHSMSDKDKEPTTAMGAAIAKYVDDYKTLPPPKVLQQWTEMFRESSDREPNPVTWTTATDNLTKRFGKLDPTGMWAITPELQAAHRKAQEFLVELKNEEIEPLKAINEAENKARKWMIDREDRYFQYIKAAERVKNTEKIDQIKSAFLKQYGYIPSQRR